MKIRHVLVLALAGLLSSTAVQADVLTYVCVGKESFFPQTLENHEQKISEKPTTVRVEHDRLKNTLTLRGTAQADGSGAAESKPMSYWTSYPKTIVAFGVTFKHVFVTLPQNGKQMSVMVTTHLKFDAPEWEGRALFLGTCRLPVSKS